jgi:hypothetical protein
MKSIRKIAGKVTALAVAITTSVALLSPYDAQAGSGATVGGGSDPQYNCNKKTCYYYNDFAIETNDFYSGNQSNANAGGGGISGSIKDKSIGLNGNGSSSNSSSTVVRTQTTYARLCYAPGGCLKSCSEMNGKTGSGVTKTCNSATN